MKIACIGDIIGRPGRRSVKKHLKKIRETHGIDLVVANSENASHGFGITPKNVDELLAAGCDVLTGGNHTWDKKELIACLTAMPNILRPGNYPSEVPGTGIWRGYVGEEKVAIISLMGHTSMPMVENPFRWIENKLSYLHHDGYETIIIDFHAEVTSEKRGMLMMLKNKVSVIFGTHTHVGTDDLTVHDNTGYITDLGLTGCRDNVIGMDSKVPIERFMTGLPGRFDVPDKCKRILQLCVFEVHGGKCTNAYKIKAYDDAAPFVSGEALIEEDE